MTEPEYSLFLSLGAWLCATGSIFNLFKLRSRGNSALILSSAFLVMGGLLWMIRAHAAKPLIDLAVVALVLLLVIDVVVRSRKREKLR